MGAREREHEDGFALPTQVGRYRILAPIGSGGMATVLLARAEGIGGFEREVALKLIHPHLMKDEELVRQFLTEARVAARVRHPNVVPVLDVGEHSQGVHLVMEYVQGDSLTGLRRQARRAGGDLPATVWMRILTDSLLGLHAAHEITDEEGKPMGVVHRDFTPHNILVGIDGVSRLCDFGVVKVTASSEHTATGIVKGKLRYMAPEQARGRQLDRRCDVWAAGVTAWELFAGQSLHQQGDPVELLLQIAMDTPPRLRSVAPDVPEAIDEAIAWALTVELDQRCPTAAVLRAKLLEAWGGQAKLASLDEVAEWVQRLCTDKLQRLDRKIERFQELREEMGSLVDPIDDDTTTSRAPAAGVDRRAKTKPAVRVAPLMPAAADDAAPATGDAPDDSPVAPEHTLSSANLAKAQIEVGRPRHRRLMMGAAVTVAAVAAAGLAWHASVDEAPLEARAAWGNLELPTVPSSSASAGVFVAMELEADALMVALQVNGNAVPLEGPSRRAPLEVAEPAGSTITIEATSKDGRRLHQKVVVRPGVAKLRFPRVTGGWRRRPAPESPYE